MKTVNKEKILMCLSGGVDSSVATALLIEQGYSVTGAFMINYDQDNGQCWQPDYQDALRVCAKLGIGLLKLNFTKEYSRDVLDYMFKQYQAGKTPNPDVLCNKYIKFGAWLEKANQLGFAKIATGHYAKVFEKDQKYFLQQAKDKNKDQTYFLHQLNQEQLSKTIFPLGNYTKTQVRSLAKKFNLPTANKAESMGICFIGEVPMKEFLQTKIKAKPGEIILSQTNEKIGHHDGLPFYTIGQRHLKVKKDNRPLFVLSKNLSKNELIVGYEDDPLLYRKEIIVDIMHWISGQEPKNGLKCEVRLRHRQSLEKCLIKSISAKKYKIIFDNKQKAVTQGQFAVIYKNNNCLGGGEIQ